MRVSISHEEVKKGMIFKKTFYQVTLRCEFSEEEKKIIEDADLDKTVVIERPPPADRPDNDPKMADIYYLKIYRLRKYGVDEYCWATPREAKQYADELEARMPKLKEFIMSNGKVETGTRTMEL